MGSFYYKFLVFLYWLVYLLIGVLFYYYKGIDIGDQKKIFDLVLSCKSYTSCFSLIMFQGYHILYPFYAYTIYILSGFEYIGLFNLFFFVIAANLYVKTLNQNAKIAFFLLIFPTCAYIFSYLREPIMFSLVLYFLVFIKNNKKAYAWSALAGLLFVRFYWAAVIVLRFGITRKNLLYFMVFTFLVSSMFPSIFNYIYLSIYKINLSFIDSIRVFIIPLPSLSYGPEVDLVESAIIYSMTFVIKSFCILILILQLRNKSFWERCFSCWAFQVAVLLLFASFMASLIGPRQTVLGQALLYSAIINYSRIRIS